MMRFALIGVLVCAGSGAVAFDAQKSELIEAMQANGCKMTSAQASVQMPKMGLDRAQSIKLSREMMAEGIVTFADDEETLLLLPPACKP